MNDVNPNPELAFSEGFDAGIQTVFQIIEEGDLDYSECTTPKHIVDLIKLTIEAEIDYMKSGA